jgi:hypothetical protein
MQCVQQAQNLTVLRLLCVKRGLTAKFIYDMVIGKMVKIHSNPRQIMKGMDEL